MKWNVVEGDCLEVLRTMEDASIDSVVCDPPYELTANKKGGSGAASVDLSTPYGRARIGAGNGPGGFMGKKWDATGIAHSIDLWREVLRVLKPGGHLLAFGGTRTYHRMACAIEDAGFEIRDSIHWIYGSGFPKSKNLGDGWGTALKPAHEPVVMARKPLDGTVASNVEKYGTGAINVDGGRIGTLDDLSNGVKTSTTRVGFDGGFQTTTTTTHNLGRWPANIILGCACEAEHEAGCPVRQMDEQSGVLKSGVGSIRKKRHQTTAMSGSLGEPRGVEEICYGDIGGASRFFYCAKASTSERDAGLTGPLVPGHEVCDRDEGSAGADHPRAGTRTERRNVHPTVKPVTLMRYLVRLVTPPNGLVLDPFTGSGTTGIAAVLEGFRFIGIERESEYVAIARARIENAAKKPVQLEMK